MLNKYPLWKYALILVVLAIGFIYSAPNLYPDDPAVQISGASSALRVNQADLDRVSKALVDAGITVKGASLGEKGSGLIRLTNQEDQLPAKDVVRKALGDDYVVALNLAQTTPQWLRNLGASPMKLGLDLSGGVHFLLEVDMDKAMSARMKVYEGEVKTLLRKERIRYRSLPQQDGGVMLGFADDATREQARALIRKNFNDFDLTTTERNELAVLRLALTQAKVAEIREYSIKQNLTTVRNRVNELGVAEPLVQRQGANRIVVELPGVQDTAEAKRILGKTANLEFRFGAEPGASKATTEVFEFREGNRSAAVERGLIITGDQVTDAQASFDEHGRPQVNIRLDGHGGELMSRATRSNVGRSMAVIFIEQKPVTRYVKQTVDGVEKDVAVQSFQEEKKIISLATIQSPLGSQFRITGLNGQGESSELALLLRAGGLAAPMYFAEERTIGPSLGADNITKGIDASLWGMLFVSLFIIAIYRGFGVIATACPGGQHGPAAGADVAAGRDPDPARHRRYRVDHGYGGGRQRTDLLAYPRGAECRYVGAARHSRRFQPRLYRDHRRQPDQPAGRRHPVRHGYRPGQGLRGHHVPRDFHLDVHRRHGDPCNGQPDLRRA